MTHCFISSIVNNQEDITSLNISRSVLASLGIQTAFSFRSKQSSELDTYQRMAAVGRSTASNTVDVDEFQCIPSPLSQRSRYG